MSDGESGDRGDSGMPAGAAEDAADNVADASLGRRIGRGTMWSGVSTIVVRLANFGVAAVVARLLDPQDFGVFAAAITVGVVLCNVGELGVSANLMRTDQKFDAIAPTVRTISLTTSAVLAALMAGFAGPLAGALGAPQADDPIRVLAIGVLLVGLFAVPSTVLARDFRQDLRFVAELAGLGTSTALLLALAAAGSGAMAFAWSRVAGQLVAGLVMSRLARGVTSSWRIGWERSRAATLLQFGLPLAGANLVNYTLLNLDYVVIGRTLGAVSLGFYVLAFNISSWSSGLLSSMVNSVAMPAFARVKDDRVLLHQYLAQSIRGVCTIAFPVAGVSLVLAGPLVTTIYGRRWAAAAPAVAALAVYGALRVLCELCANVVVGLGRTRQLLVVQLIWFVALAPAMVVGVERRGILGAGLAHLAVVVTVVVPAYLAILRRAAVVPGRLVARAAVPPLLASMGATLAAAVATVRLSGGWPELAVGLSVFGVVYLAGISPWAWPEIRRALWNRKPRFRDGMVVGSSRTR